MNTTTVIVAELRAGERTTTELMQATGATRNAVLCALYGLAAAGYTVANETPRGGRADGRYRLVFDPEHPCTRTCHWPGCATHLNRYNANRYCLRHRHEVVALVLSCIDWRLAREEACADEAEQLELVV